MLWLNNGDSYYRARRPSISRDKGDEDVSENKEIIKAIERAALRISGKAWLIPADPKDAKCLVTFEEAFEIIKFELVPHLHGEIKFSPAEGCIHHWAYSTAGWICTLCGQYQTSIQKIAP